MERAWEPIARERSGPVRGVVVLLVAVAALLVMAGGASAKSGPKAQGENCGRWSESPAEGCEPATLAIVKEVPGESATVFPFMVSYRVGGWWWNAESKRKARHGAWPSGPKWISTSFDLSDNGVASANTKTLEIALRGGAWVVIRETGDNGWALTDASCTGAWKNGTRDVKIHHRASDGILIRVRHGEDVTCTLTNGTPAPTLHLMKTVVNDHGGTAVAGDFALKATGSIAGNDVSGNGEAHSTAALKADTFTLSETGPAGYAAGAWVCEGREWVEQDMTPSSLRKKAKHMDGGWWHNGSWTAVKAWPINDNQIVLGPRDEVTCRITNDDIAPSLTITKVVVNNDAGTSTAADFTLTATGALEGNVFSGAGPVVASGATLKADTFTLSEAGPEGYTASWVCVGGTLTGATIPVGIGQAVACTVTNDDVGPTPPITPVVPETPVVPAVAPPAVQPVIAPPVTLRGTVRLAGARGCVQPGTILSRVSGENVASVRFFRDGRLVKSVNVNGTRVVTLATRIRAADRKLHTVTARVQFVEGATPSTRTVTHRFRNCRQSILPPVIAGVTG